MINLLRSHLSQSALADCFATSPLRPLLPPADSAEWDRVRASPLTAKWRAAIRASAEADAVTPPPVLTADLYAEFHRSGSRLSFETVYFERRRRLARGVLAVVLEPPGETRGRLSASMLTELRSLLAEESWALPAHVDDASGIDPMQIDLFSAETANLVGEIVNLLGEELPGELVERFRQRLNTQFFTNFVSNEFWWSQSTGNWNAVCHQGVLGAALALVEDPVLLARIVFKAVPHLQTFLSGFNPDGSTSEGPAYWTYGFGRFAELNRQLETRTDGRLSLMHGDPHTAAIARFGPTMTLSNGYCVNFADCAPKREIPPALLTYLGTRLDDAGLQSAAAVAWKRFAGSPVSLHGQRDDLYHLTRLLLAAPDQPPANADQPCHDLLLEGIEVVVSTFKDPSGHLWEFAAKAGHNDELHNHNDVGSYLLNIDGERLLIEIGAPEYTKAYFSEARYHTLAARSFGHAVPQINGIEQSAGRQFSGKILSRVFEPERLSLAIDLTAAYPPEANCVQCVRRFELDKRADTLRVTDEVEFKHNAGEVESPILVDHEVIGTADGFTIIANAVRAKVTPLDGTRTLSSENHPYNAMDGTPATVRRIAFAPALVGRRVVFGFSLTTTDTRAD